MTMTIIEKSDALYVSFESPEYGLQVDEDGLVIDKVTASILQSYQDKALADYVMPFINATCIVSDHVTAFHPYVHHCYMTLHGIEIYNIDILGVRAYIMGMHIGGQSNDTCCNNVVSIRCIWASADIPFGQLGKALQRNDIDLRDIVPVDPSMSFVSRHYNTKT